MLALRLEFCEVDSEMRARLLLLILVDADERVCLAVEGILERDDDHLHAVAGATSAERRQKRTETGRHSEMNSER